MTFADYIDLVVESVSETGYDTFFPSLVIVEGEGTLMKVLEGELSAEGEERLALHWAESFLQDTRTVYLSFRLGQGTVAILEICGHDAIRKQEIVVNPPASD